MITSFFNNRKRLWRRLPSSLANVTWLDFTLGFSAFVAVAIYEYFRRQRLLESDPEPPVANLLWNSVAHIPSVCLREAFNELSDVVSIKDQLNKCIQDYQSLPQLSQLPQPPSPSSIFSSIGHKAAFVVLCTVQLALCLFTAFFIAKSRGTVRELYYDVIEVTESVQEAYYLIDELSARVATASESKTLSDTLKKELIEEISSQVHDRFNNPIGVLKHRLQSVEENVSSLQRTNSHLNPRAQPYRSKPTRDPRDRQSENYRSDFRGFDSRNEFRFDSNFSDSRPWKPWSRSGTRPPASSTPNSAPVEFYGEKRPHDRVEKCDKSPAVFSPIVTKNPSPETQAIVTTSIPSPPKLTFNSTPQMSKKIIIKAGDREYDLASAEGREQWTSVARRNIAKSITLPSHAQSQEGQLPPLASLRTASTRPHTIELSPLTSSYSSETDGTEDSKSSKAAVDDKECLAEKEGKDDKRVMDNYVETVESPQSPSASLTRALQLKLEGNVSNGKESIGRIGDITEEGGDKKPYRRLFIPGRGWVSARRIALEKAQEDHGDTTVREDEVSIGLGENNISVTAA